MVCKACGKELKENSKFCVNCGAKIEPQTETEIETETETETETDEITEGIQTELVEEPHCAPEEEKKHWSPTIIGVTAVLVSAILVAAAYFGVIRPRSYENISFAMNGYENENIQSNMESLSTEVKQ